MDGVLADSEPLYHLSLNQVLQAHGHSLTDEDNRIILGTTVDFTWQTLKDRFRLDGEIEDWIGVYDEVLLKNLKENVEPSPGLYDLLDTLDAGSEGAEAWPLGSPRPLRPTGLRSSLRFWE